MLVQGINTAPAKTNKIYRSVSQQPARYPLLAREICFLGLELFREYSDSYPDEDQMRKGTMGVVPEVMP